MLDFLTALSDSPEEDPNLISRAPRHRVPVSPTSRGGGCHSIRSDPGGKMTAALPNRRRVKLDRE